MHKYLKNAKSCKLTFRKIFKQKYESDLGFLTLTFLQSILVGKTVSPSILLMKSQLTLLQIQLPRILCFACTLLWFLRNSSIIDRRMKEIMGLLMVDPVFLICLRIIHCFFFNSKEKIAPLSRCTLEVNSFFP